MAALRVTVIDRSGDCEHISILFHGLAGGDQGSAPLKAGSIEFIPAGGGHQQAALHYNTELRLRPGICIVGYLRSEIGLGQSARCLAYAADSARIESSFHNLPLSGR